MIHGPTWNPRGIHGQHNSDILQVQRCPTDVCEVIPVFPHTQSEMINQIFLVDQTCCAWPISYLNANRIATGAL